ncbi:MAG: GNVR domain-containing protein, partial [archaeon]
QDATSLIDFINNQLQYYDGELNILEIKSISYQNLTNATRDERLEYQAVQREIAAKNKIYDYLLTKREEAGLSAADSKTGSVKVISYAEAPLIPVKPNVPLNIVLGIVLAIGAAFGMALTANALDRKPKKK